MGTNISTIYLTPQKLYFVVPQKNKLLHVKPFVWDEGTLVDIFGLLKKEFSIKKVKILISEEISYTTSFISNTENLDRDMIAKHFRESVPDTILEAAWDYKVITTIGTVSLLQVFAVETTIWQLLQAAAKKHAISISMVLPTSYTVAHHLPEGHPPSLLLYVSREESFAAFLVQNHVFGIVSIDANQQQKSIEKITQLLELMKQRYKITPQLLLLPKKQKDVEMALPFLEIIKKRSTIPHPLHILAQSTIESGNDADILTLSYEVEKKHNWILLIISIFLLALAISGTMLYLNSK
ncbi:MAG: hypothetical protein GW762_06040 [Candidatus Pacebacteria bacterium]|nr:hypothetical protein [Candidatus Paceibacterota bacterium]PIR64097.1 MAG: hypothetical protein COU64_00945 [Candidatus Pacebacteria bacterium CG10_big_fil_rev_8_21_14_0_10_40_26]PIY79563.1 MAG: hypothetical protein COY81_01915 [Candidatus Pacebacteria bacterium CG_4_10_14_0_8_um_filter_43_12]PIZ78449.1 MAG: hypothetical protein COY01_04325 [Candidatus Pacebacteria bacterium CG_4_10_14_0_2_um_filter_40_20]PJA69299.1 MAG: hypothetical protein CO156_00210 [Candidatus Pacebacteria bacterium CG_4